MFLINEIKMQAAIESCLRGGNAGYYDLFWWERDAENFAKILLECLAKNETFNQQLTEKNINASCLKALAEFKQNLIPFPESDDLMFLTLTDDQDNMSQLSELLQTDMTNSMPNIIEFLQEGLEKKHAPSCFVYGRITTLYIENYMQNRAELNINTHE